METGSLIIDCGEERGPLLKVLALEGVRVSPPTATRWVVEGVRGVRLEVVRAGRRVFTSREAVRRFMAAQSAGGGAGLGPRPVADRPLQRRKLSRREVEIAGSRARCAALGCRGEVG